MKCENCNGTGYTSSGYLDCTMCDAATERARLSETIGAEVDDNAWLCYQIGRCNHDPH